MYKRIEKTKKSHSKKITGSVAQKRKRCSNDREFVDCRLLTVTQTKLKDVLQFGGKYDSVKSSALDDFNNKGDDNFSSVNDSRYIEAANELIGEYLAAGFTDRSGKVLSTPKAQISQGWGGDEGLVLIPQRKNGIPCMLGDTDTFVSSLTHELGHMAIDGKGQSAGIRIKIEEIAMKAKKEASQQRYKDIPKLDSNAWFEECRADLTGVFLRKTKEKAIPLIDAYSDTLNGEQADSQHPPGDFRLGLINEYLNYLKTTK